MSQITALFVVLISNNMNAEPTHVEFERQLESLQSIPLWSDEIPGYRDGHGSEEVREDGVYFVKNIHTPLMYVMLPQEQANGAAVVICPGGGYSGLAIDHEGVQIGKWLNSLGVAAFVLKNRVVPYHHPYPLMDAQQAIRLVRNGADGWKIRKDRVGIMGFSAGGHLAATASTHFDDGNPHSTDAVGKNGCRPDFSILGYPVVSFQEKVGHTGSRKNLLPEDASPEQIDSLSNELQIDKTTPPAFLFHSKDDRGVSYLNSKLYYEALLKNETATKLVLFESGGHGYGLGQGETATWPKACEEWLREVKVIP